MQDICREAKVSAGALYVWFESKEDLIAGIAERDRKKLADEIAEVAASADLVTALGKLGERYAVDEPKHKRLLCVEIGLEATRNPAVGEIYRSVDRFVRESFEKLFERAAEEGRIRPVLPPKEAAHIILVMGDGMFWRRAVDQDFDPKTVIPAFTAIVAGLLNPVEHALLKKTPARVARKQGANP